MLDRYHLLLASLDDSETQLLGEHLSELKRSIRPGSKRLNWTALGIQDYLNKTNSNISKLESMVNQIKKNSKDIQSFLNDIVNANLFQRPQPNPDGSLYQCKEYFDFVESKRRNDLEELTKKYKLIGPLITKVEGLVFGTNTSNSPKMASYYAYWEREIYNTIVKMVTNNLTKFNQILFDAKEPIFQIETLLAVPDVALHPNPNDMSKLFIQSVRDCVEAANLFTRWQDGSCKECLPVQEENQDEPFLYTFYYDVKNKPELHDIASQIHTNVQRTKQSVKKYLEKFRKYRSLWKAEKSAVCEKFASKNPNIVAYDEKILFYYKTNEEVQTLPKYKDVDFIKLSMRSVCESISNHVKEWIKCLGQQLNDSTNKILIETKNKLNVTSFLI